jgi:hypothetical protein
VRALLITSFCETRHSYQAAEEQARQNADMVWLAGTLEGQAVAMVMSASTTGTWADVPGVDEKYAEALSLYAKSHAVTLELEASLKLAGTLLTAHP